MMPETHMIIYRDSDQWEDDLHHISKRSRRLNSGGFSDVMCAMEELAYNRRMTGSHAAPSTQPNSTFDSLWEKREVADFRVLSNAAAASAVGVSASSSNTQGCPTARKSKFCRTVIAI